MGRLVEDMTRLVGEIHTLRGSRRAFVKELTDGEKKAKAERLAFCKELTDGERDRQTAAKAENAARHRAWAAEQAGARRAWAGQQAEFAPARFARAGRGA